MIGSESANITCGFCVPPASYQRRKLNMGGSEQPSQPWVYKPGSWDHKDMHTAYEFLPAPDLPPDSITVTLLDKNGKKTPPRNLHADYEKAAFELTDSPLLFFSNIRYVSTNCTGLCGDHVADSRFVIMVSVRRWEEINIPEECYVWNLFIQPLMAEQALAILNFLQYHIFQYLKTQTEQENPSSVLEFTRPQLVQECTVQVYWREYKKTWSEKRIVVLDPECVIFYRKSFDDAQEPRDRMFFWMEQFRKTVCKVSRIKSKKCILLQCLYMHIALQYEESTGPEIEEAFKQVKPVPRIAFQEPKTLFYWLAGRYDVESGEYLPPPVIVESVELDTEQTQKLDQFEGEVNRGLFQQDDPSRPLWNNIRPHLEQLELDDQLPVVLAEQWECNPNSVDSFLRIVAMIETELYRHVNYEKALAITVAMKEVFSKSSIDRLQRLLRDSPMDILHKIHARGVYSQRSGVTAETNLLPLDEEIEAPSLEQLEEVEEMEGVRECQQ